MTLHMDDESEEEGKVTWWENTNKLEQEGGRDMKKMTGEAV